MSEAHKHNWALPDFFTVDMRLSRDFLWCITCGTLHYFGVEHKPALESKLERAIRGLEEIRDLPMTDPLASAYNIAEQLLKDLQEGDFTEIQ